MIKVVLAVSSNLYRQSLKDSIKSEEDIKIVQEISYYSELIPVLNNDESHVLFLDLNLQGLKIVEYLNLIREKKSHLKVLLMMNSTENEKIINALCFGVKGCLDINSTKEQFLQAIRAVHNEEIWADTSLVSRALNKILNSKKNDLNDLQDLKNKLTKQEEKIAQLILKGFSNKEIAKALFISEKTVKTHLGHIFKKLGIKSRYQLTANYLGGEIFPTES
ncbi:MAG: response regulator transcription factor [Thermodesulfobacteriota bacterium]